ncbi:hypothetical protein PFLUV_G00056230 [Perca fluviatilis]|uniref:Uncharacterized protein n=1 Tax=Perca fluviatilis TaxID=8168 RepID=A0A6A5ELX9_PERFL|nr:hypothetical protein PFLUV_G00056230 [Perca fluviatilis]
MVASMRLLLLDGDLRTIYGENQTVRLNCQNSLHAAILLLKPSNKTTTTRFYPWKLQNIVIWVLPLPALNKDNYSGNISANQTQPCILPVRKATSQDLANITGA